MKQRRLRFEYSNCGVYGADGSVTGSFALAATNQERVKGEEKVPLDPMKHWVVRQEAEQRVLDAQHFQKRVDAQAPMIEEAGDRFKE
eukprot:713383-Prorocentrum_minimum.AAC.1